VLRSCVGVRVHGCVLVESRLVSTMRGYQLGGAVHAHNLALHSAPVSREEQRRLMAVSLSLSRSSDLPLDLPPSPAMSLPVKGSLTSVG
jgi:hypothetical protein